MKKAEAIESVKNLGVGYFADFDLSIIKIFETIQKTILPPNGKSVAEINCKYWRDNLTSIKLVLKKCNEEELDWIQRNYFGYRYEKDKHSDKGKFERDRIESARKFFQDLADHIGDSIKESKRQGQWC